MNAGKEETTCLLGVGGQGSVKASVQVPVKLIIGICVCSFRQKEAACCMEKRECSGFARSDS